MYREKKQHGTYGFPFELYHNLCRNGLNIYTHYHREFEIIHIISGSGTAYVDDKCYQVSTGDILFISSEQIHGVVKNSDTPGEYVAIVFAPEFIGESDRIADKYITPVLNNTIRIPELIQHKQLREQLLELASLTNNSHYELKAKYSMLMIWEILISISEINTAKENKIKLVEIKNTIDYIKSNYSQKITLSELAASGNMSKEYFCKKFKEITGVSPIQYLMHIRIENSCLLLKNTDAGIGEVAMKCGFSSFSYFSEMFKKNVKCTPKEYRSKFTNY